MTPIRILLIDHDQTQELILRSHIKRSVHTQFELDWVSSAKKARPLIQQNNHDVF